MSFHKLLEKRRSVRAFKPNPVSDETVDKILDAINLAPSAGNVQAFRVKIVRDKDVKVKLAKAAFDQKFLAEAPMVLAFLAVPAESAAHYGERGEKLYSVQDATVALYTAHLMAAEQGLGSVWVGAFHEGQVMEALNLDSRKYFPVGMLPLGHMNDEPKERQRKRTWELLLD